MSRCSYRTLTNPLLVLIFRDLHIFASMKHFKFYNKKDIHTLTHVRRFETKLGEQVKCRDEKISLEDALRKTACKYILFGIPEDIGVKANQGLGGTDSAWFPFLSSFLNIQSNDLLSGENILLLGHFDFNDLKLLIESNAATPDE